MILKRKATALDAFLGIVAISAVVSAVSIYAVPDQHQPPPITATIAADAKDAEANANEPEPVLSAICRAQVHRFNTAFDRALAAGATVEQMTDLEHRLISPPCEAETNLRAAWQRDHAWQLDCQDSALCRSLTPRLPSVPKPRVD